MYLLAGGLLITAASVYGITDYVKNRNHDTFKNLYKETPVLTKESEKPQDVKEEDFSTGKIEPLPPPKKQTKSAVATKLPREKTKLKKKTNNYHSGVKMNDTTSVTTIKTEASESEAKTTVTPDRQKNQKKKI